MFRVTLSLLFFGVTASGCMSARVLDAEADRLFREGRLSEAAERLKAGLTREGEGSNDELLYLMDLGLVLHTAGDYQESNKYFLKAEKAAEIKDYTSLSTEAFSLIAGDNIGHYKGEDFEKILISLYISLNFAGLGDAENAQVAARRVNRKLFLMRTEGKRNYDDNALAHVIGGYLYELTGEPDNAYVSYKEALKLLPGERSIVRDVWRMAKKLRFQEDLDRWEHDYTISSVERTHWGKAAREGLIVFQNGLSPIKRPSPNFYNLPVFRPRSNPNSGATVYVDDAERGRTSMMTDVEHMAYRTLEEKYAPLIAKKIAGAVAKELISDQVAKSTKSDLAGALTRLGLYLMDQPDLRSWNLLPHDFQVLRIAIENGSHKIRLQGDGVTTWPLNERDVMIPKKGPVIMSFRYVPA